MLPPYLSAGSTIGMVCPSGYMPLENVQNCIKAFEARGYKIRIGKTVGNQFNYFAGTDEERLTDLQQMLDDDSIDAILCGRGGYGLSRIIDSIDFTKFNHHPKWLIGFSDITVLHAHINTSYGIATIHAPMAAAFNATLNPNPYTHSLFSAIEGSPLSYSTAAHPLNKQGKAIAELIGGNLTIIAHLVGSKSAYHTKGKILFIEDIDEYLYHIDRMMISLKRSGKLTGLAGLLVGDMTDMKDNEVKFGMDAYSIIADAVKDYNYPVWFGFPAGHSALNNALILGRKVSMQVSKISSLNFF